MNKELKEEALIIADDLDAMKLFGASGMIRRLVEELDKQTRETNHFRKHIVFYQDIAMVGDHSEEYENGFWDAVDFVKQHQTKEIK